MADFEAIDRRDWDTIFELSTYLHATPVFVVGGAEVSTAEMVTSIADSAARIATDIASHLEGFFAS